MTNYTKTAVKGVGIILITSLAAAFFGYVVRLILARGLTIEEFGLFYAVFAFLALLSVFKTLGFDRALSRFIPTFKHNKEYGNIKGAIVYSSIIQAVTSSIIIAGVYIFSDYLSSSYFHSNQASRVLIIMAIAFLFDSFILVLKFAFQGFRNPILFSGIDLIRMILVGLIAWIGMRNGYGIMSVLVAYLVTPIIILFIFGGILIKKVFPEFLKYKIQFSKDLFKKVSRYSIFTMASSFGRVILGYTDTIMLTYFLGLKSVALYNVALPTSQLLAYFPRAIGDYLIPLSSELWVKKEINLLKEGLKVLYKYSVIILTPAVLALFSFSDVIIAIFYGHAYEPATNALRILSIGMLFTALYSINLSFFAGIGKPELNSKIVYSGAIFNFVTNLMAIPILGIEGAAMTTSLTYLLMMIAGLVYMKKSVAIEFPFFSWIKTLFAGAVFLILSEIIKNALPLNDWMKVFVVPLICGVFYFGMLFLLKVIDIKEVKDIYKRIMKSPSD